MLVDFSLTLATLTSSRHVIFCPNNLSPVFGSSTHLQTHTHGIRTVSKRNLQTKPHTLSSKIQSSFFRWWRMGPKNSHAHFQHFFYLFSSNSILMNEIVLNCLLSWTTTHIKYEYMLTLIPSLCCTRVFNSIKRQQLSFFSLFLCFSSYIVCIQL